MKKRFSNIVKSILIWRLKYISDKRFILILSVIVGVIAGFGAVTIKNLVHLLKHILTYQLASQFHNYLFFVYPTIGIFFTVLFTKYIIKHHVRHGVPSTLYAISKNNGIMKSHNMFSSIITSVLTVGFGGSVGLEGPTVATGAAFGSNIGRLFRLDYRRLTLLLACASAGAMAAIFKAPIAAIVFVLEVIMLDLTMTTILPVLLASVSGALTSYLFLGQDTILQKVVLTEKFLLADIPLYILLGILTGFLSLYFTRTFIKVTDYFEKTDKVFKKLLLGGGILGVLIFSLPTLYGEGYEVINSCLKGDYSFLTNNSLNSFFNNHFSILFLLFAIVLLLKPFATTITFAIGGVGGIFAPSLFMGANFGLFFALLANYFHFDINIVNFALVGMAGTIAGVLHAPLTAIFLIAEITSGYQLLMPLMIVSTISYATMMHFEPNSVYTYQLARRGELLTHHKDKNVLSLMRVKNHLETNFIPVHLDNTLGDLVQDITKSHRNLFPVVDDENNFMGVIYLDNIRHIMFKPELYDNTFVKNLMIVPDLTISIDEPMEQVATKIQKSGKFNIPVLKDGKYQGFVSRANIFSSYRKLLKTFSEH
ncbi:MAG: chloride channel protein [Chlorobi bacterium]|nr:chloride channel protein [Chlorobiota bacterium]